jgi:hypothetical protein
VERLETRPLGGATSTEWERFALAGLIALYTVAYVLLVVGAPPIVNPDATAYLNLGQHWVDGDLAEAVVAHWAPMYSWLIAPLLALGFEPFTAALIVQGASGLAVLVACWLVLGRLSLRHWARFLTCLAVVPLICWSWPFTWPSCSCCSLAAGRSPRCRSRRD